MSRPISAAIRRQVEYRSDGCCEAGIPGTCDYSANQMHHRKARSQHGENSAENLLHVCFPCHRAITDHKPGTKKYRTKSWQEIGTDEMGVAWQPPHLSKSSGDGPSLRFGAKVGPGYGKRQKSKPSEFPDNQVDA